MPDLNLVNKTTLKECLNLTWYLMARYSRLGLVGKPDAFVGGRPCWRITRIEEIKQRINRYESQIAEAKYSPTTI